MSKIKLTPKVKNKPYKANAKGERSLEQRVTELEKKVNELLNK